ncbi:MAG: aspartyl-phosphate phosphatase Spo0E family protein [Zhaonellaceae bacterium]|jgi:hypothetical protein|nr:Spo0E family sporulation regulatory protein-aspartic acid phosphatase [Clostridia bacterium]
MKKKLPAKTAHLSKMISVKSAELTKLCLKKKVSLLDPEIYKRSLELDELVVQYMRNWQNNK